MTSSGRKPFENKAFYLDLKIYRNRDSLVKDLKKLGAKVEGFLSKDVNYVVTDRNDIKCKIESWMPGTPKSGISTPSPIQLQGSGLEHLDSPVLTSSPANDPSKNQIMSRGLALVQRAKQKNQGTTDVIEVCNQWGIKVLHVNKVISWITKFKDLHCKKRYERKNLTSQKLLELEASKLAAPFVKVEDVDRNFRPTYKVFKSWKDSTDPDLEAVVTQLRKKIKLDKSSSSNCYKENFNPAVSRAYNTSEYSYQSSRYPLTSAGQNLSIAPSSKLRHNKIVKNSNCISSSATKGYFVPPLQPSGMKSFTLYASDQKYSSRRYGNHETEEKTKTVKKRYCEICCCSYTNLDSHLLTENHRNYFNEPKNFQVIEEVTSSFPDLQHFVSKIEQEPMEISIPQRLQCSNYENALFGCCNMCEVSNEVPKDASYMLQELASRKSDEMFDMVHDENSNECISGSCSTPGSSNSFPFLEDSIDKLIKPGDVKEVFNTSLIIAPVDNLRRPALTKRKVSSFSFHLPYNQTLSTLPANEHQAITISGNLKANEEIKQVSGLETLTVSTADNNHISLHAVSDKQINVSNCFEINTLQVVEKTTAIMESTKNEGEFERKSGLGNLIRLVAEQKHTSLCTDTEKQIELNAVTFGETTTVIGGNKTVKDGFKIEGELQNSAVLTVEGNHTLTNIISDKQIDNSNKFFELSIVPFKEDKSYLGFVNEKNIYDPQFNVVDPSLNILKNPLLSQEESNLQEKCKLGYIQSGNEGNASCEEINKVIIPCPEAQVMNETHNLEVNNLQQSVQSNQTSAPLKILSQVTFEENLKPFSLYKPCPVFDVSENKPISTVVLPRKCEEIQNEAYDRCSSYLSSCSECEWEDLHCNVDNLCQSLEDETATSDSLQNIALDLTVNSVLTDV